MSSHSLILTVCMLGLIAFGPASPTRAQALVMVGNEQMIEMTREQLVQNVFRNQHSLADAERHAASALAVQIDFVALIGTLRAGQRDQLELAGQGDIHRYFSDFESYLATAPTGQITMQQWNDIWQGLQPLQARYTAGLHGRDSLFRKTLPTTLDEDQFAAYQVLEQQRSRQHYQAVIKATLAAIDGKIPLTTAQREQILRLMLEKTRPPRSYGQSYYQYHIVLYQMSTIEADLKPLFAENEWELMQKILQQGRMIEHMRQRGGVELEIVEEPEENLIQ
ncbi:MAG: hypothetical protein KF861_16250 [Planctomycetaceae bacterium]|nr:hypothetical protein [Planctomycetaceae bacterium]